MAARKTSYAKPAAPAQPQIDEPGVRLECLKLAVEMRSNSPRSQGQIEIAESFFQYVKNGPKED